MQLRLSVQQAGRARQIPKASLGVYVSVLSLSLSMYVCECALSLCEYMSVIMRVCFLNMFIPTSYGAENKN